MNRIPSPALLALALAACATSATPDEGWPEPPGAAVEELLALHGEVRVPGLEDRTFGPEYYRRVMDPYLGESVQSVEAGTSAEGRPIYHLTFGSGPVRVLLWSQMHGNESTASMSLADLVRFFHEQPDHPVVRRIAAGATVHMIPMLNPDGAARFRRRNAQGIDVNRDARLLQTPEGRTLKAVRDAVEPEFGFNLHDQGAAIRVGDSDRGVAIALLTPPFDEARSVNDRRHAAMQVAAGIVRTIDPLVGGHVARYDDTFNPRAFGDLMAAWGAGTILIESGAWADDPQKQYLRATNFVAILSALDAIATGVYRGWDPAPYLELPPNGRRIPDLLIAGGTVVVPGLPPLQADLLVAYARPLLKQEGEITDIGDMGEAEAQDTLRLDGLYLIPMDEALDEWGTLDVGLPARFIVAEDPEGTRERFRFLGGPPSSSEPDSGGP